MKNGSGIRVLRTGRARGRALPVAFALSALVPALTPSVARAQEPDTLEVRLRLDRGADPVVEQGDEVRIYYEASRDAHVAIFRLDTEGRGTLLFPQHPGADTRIRGGREYRLLLPESRSWEVTDAQGEGAFVMIASDEPLDFSLFDFDDDAGWDLTTVSEARYDDPYDAIDAYVVAVLPRWEEVPYALDLVAYEVVAAGEAPRSDESAAYGRGPSREGRPSARAPRVVLVLPPAVRYAPPPAYRRPPRYGPPPPRYAPCCRYRAPRTRYYGPAPRSPRVRPTPPVYGRPPHAPPRRGRYKERPVRISR